LLNNNRQCERERRALARLRLDPNPSAVHLNDALRYGETQASVALLAGDGVVRLLKLLKQRTDTWNESLLASALMAISPASVKAPARVN
jgi:hypothetical protein